MSRYKSNMKFSYVENLFLSDFSSLGYFARYEIAPYFNSCQINFYLILLFSCMFCPFFK